jgi:hypothetical protein
MAEPGRHAIDYTIAPVGNRTVGRVMQGAP